MAQLPSALLGAIDALAAQCERAALARDAQAISESYRLRTGHGERLLTRAGEAVAYAAARLPAPYAAARCWRWRLSPAWSARTRCAAWAVS